MAFKARAQYFWEAVDDDAQILDITYLKLYEKIFLAMRKMHPI